MLLTCLKRWGYLAVINKRKQASCDISVLRYMRQVYGIMKSNLHSSSDLLRQ